MSFSIKRRSIDKIWIFSLGVTDLKWVRLTPKDPNSMGKANNILLNCN